MVVDNRLRDMNSLTLAAVASAAGFSRLLARTTLQQWELTRMVDDSEMVISELVTNAVEATGVTDPHPQWRALANLAVIRVRLLLYDTRLIIDVWDRESTAPVLKEAVPEDEYGRGLSIVDALCTRWDYFYPQTGGKVVWAELAIPVYDLLPPSLPKRQQSPLAANSGTDDMPAIETLERVLAGLRRV
jgi:anti-sigma regulatory factor (Ser/Thr protein kinase)